MNARTVLKEKNIGEKRVPNDQIEQQIDRLIIEGKQALNDFIRQKEANTPINFVEEVGKDLLIEGAGQFAKDLFGVPSRMGSKYTRGYIEQQKKIQNKEILNYHENCFRSWSAKIRNLLSHISEIKPNLSPNGNSKQLLRRFQKEINYVNIDTNYKHTIGFLENLKNRALIENNEIKSLPKTASSKKTDKTPDILKKITDERRSINLIFQDNLGFKLFKDNELAILDIQKDCRSEDDFTLRVQSLCNLIDGVDIKELKKRINNGNGNVQPGSINLLKAFMDTIYPDYNDKLITNLRLIMSLRSKKFPVHKDTPEFLKVLRQMGFKHYPPDWSKLWKKCIEGYYQSLVYIHDCQNMDKVNA